MRSVSGDELRFSGASAHDGLIELGTRERAWRLNKPGCREGAPHAYPVGHCEERSPPAADGDPAAQNHPSGEEIAIRQRRTRNDKSDFEKALREPGLLTRTRFVIARSGATRQSRRLSGGSFGGEVAIRRRRTRNDKLREVGTQGLCKVIGLFGFRSS